MTVNELTNYLGCNIKVGNKSVLCSGAITYAPENELEFLDVKGLKILLRFKIDKEKESCTYELIPNNDDCKMGILTLYNYIPSFHGTFQLDIPLTKEISLSFSIFGASNIAILLQYSFFVKQKEINMDYETSYSELNDLLQEIIDKDLDCVFENDEDTPRSNGWRDGYRCAMWDLQKMLEQKMVELNEKIGGNDAT